MFLEDAREACHGPLVVVIPPGAVHAFRFSRDTDGQVLTFNPRAVIEGDVPATAEALRAVFVAPRTLQFEPGAASTQRIATLMADLSDAEVSQLDELLIRIAHRVVELGAPAK